MSVTYPVAFPTGIGIQSISLRLRKSVAMTESPFTFKQQTYDFGSARWEAEVTIPPLSPAQARLFEAFLASLEGQKGQFTMGHPQHTSTFTNTVTGSLGNDVCNFSGSTVITAGTYFSVAGAVSTTKHLHLVVNSSNQPTIQPPLRKAYSNSAVEFTAPVGTWRLASNEVGWTTGAGGNTPFTFACVEVL